MSGPNPQDPDSPLYDFVDTQPADEPPASPDSSLSNFTLRQFVPENITASLPIIVTKTAHGLQNGQAVRCTQFITIPMAVATGMEQLNNKLYYVQQVTDDNFQLYDVNGYPVDGRNFTAYVQGGQMTLTGPDVLIVNPSNFPPSGYPAFPP